MTKAEPFKFAEVGGAVRDMLLNIESKDVDFTAITNRQFNNVDEAFNTLVEYLKHENFEVFLTTPEFYTVRTQVPDGHPLKNRTNIADFVLARKDGPYSDGRHPDWVVPGTLYDDLERRDFTVNAMAIFDGELIDPFNGQLDLENRILRFVGDPMQRIQEDGLRVVRALRFSITKDFVMNSETFEAINSQVAINSLNNVSNDRIVAELMKMFTKSTIDSIHLISTLNIDLQETIFNSGVWLMPTLKKRRQ